MDYLSTIDMVCNNIKRPTIVDLILQLFYILVLLKKILFSFYLLLTF